MDTIRWFNTRSRRAALSLAALAMACVAPVAANAQTATIYGSLGNFDVVNNSGDDAHGFEVELEGLQPNDVYYTFSAQRYGPPTIAASATGVTVTWASDYDAASNVFLRTTVAHAPNTPFAGTCYQWYPATYDAAGCEHFGISLRAPAVRTTYRWLVADTNTPGALVAVDPPMAIASPVYAVVPPAVAGDPPALAVEVEAPEPPETPELYGDAQWMKIFVTQLPREVTLDELVADNPMVPQDAAQIEVDWTVVQADPISGGNQRRSRNRNQKPLDPTTRSVVRRIELYEYTGAYDPVTHEALCADLVCNAPAVDEVGDFISAQMTAANVQSNSVTVATSGNGNVSSSDKLISCGNKCVASYNEGTAVTLTAKAGSGSVFAGWTGGCAGATSVCTVSAVGAVRVVATFTLAPSTSGGGSGGGGGGGAGGSTLSVKLNGKGTVTSAPAGISCGKTCTASVAAGTAMTLSAVPEAGFHFVNWSGACTGTTTTCSVSVNGSTSVQANFAK